jgi:TolB protein
MKANRSTAAVFAVVGAVAAAAAIDALGGGSASAPSTERTSPRPAPHLVVARPGPAPMRLVRVGVRRRPGARIRVIAELLRLGPAVGTPSRERVAFWASNPSRPGLDGIYTRAAGGGALERITTPRSGDLETPLAYSPDGSRLLFFQASRDPLAGSVEVVRADGGHLLHVTPRGMTSWCCELGPPASFGPDGRIAVAAFPTGASGRGSAIYLMDAKGSTPHRITRRVTWFANVRWSPDGRWIAFDRLLRPGGPGDLFVVHPDGSGLHMVPVMTGDKDGLPQLLQGVSGQ